MKNYDEKYRFLYYFRSMKNNQDPGLGVNFQKHVNRYMNSNGSYNITRKGKGAKQFDIYSWCVHSHWLALFIALVVVYSAINLVFGLSYYFIGINQFKGVDFGLGAFLNCFFFSVQTFTTVGYGSISPQGLSAHVLAMFEAFLGFLSFSLATGVLYGRFSKPKARIRFSENVIITPYQDKTAMMFKLVNLRSKVLLNNKIQVILMIDSDGLGENQFNKQYFRLNLEVDFINFFPLTWTIVHLIDEDSPLLGLDVTNIKERSAEIIILLEGYDETFSQGIVRRHSYANEQWLADVKFTRNFVTDDFGSIILNLDELDAFESIEQK